MILNQALVTLGMNMQRLWFAGARQFLVANAPNIALTPAVAAQGPGAQFLSQVLATTYNAFLERDVLGPAEAFPGISISRMDVFGALSEVVGLPQSPFFSNVVTPCLTFFVIADAVCEDPDRTLFWDAIHPTRAGHAVLAAEAAAALGGT
ncbi:MAG: hypothetical protein GWN29_02490 [Gammaproteobacteria bacterium]|nr:hypothetical protein [Gammaproteobacteria bacterium]